MLMVKITVHGVYWASLAASKDENYTERFRVFAVQAASAWTALTILLSAMMNEDNDDGDDDEVFDDGSLEAYVDALAADLHAKEIDDGKNGWKSGSYVLPKYTRANPIQRAYRPKVDMSAMHDLLKSIGKPVQPAPAVPEKKDDEGKDWKEEGDED